uniref:Retrovirus-related Pol polyprotein from transposon opus n=1 Tax=Tanacetum cinerariifolium TaxID=118510 RepID=A0A6L2MDT8_TANCI|nr:retrovirus-related Pol polyprotein from transposon opus [Tanacetum cinerariifolium]
MENTHTWIEAREVSTNRTPNDHRESFDRFKKNSSWDNNKGKKNMDKFPPCHGSNHILLFNLSKSLREILATEKELKHQIEEAVKLGKLAHMVKGIKRRKAKALGTQLGEWKNGDMDMKPVKAHILVISREDQTSKKRSMEESVKGIREITFPPVSGVNNSFDPVIIKVHVSRRQVNQVYMDSGSSCKVIYEHCFLKLKPSIRSLRIDSKVPCVGFSGEHSWPLGEVPLEITVGESPFARTKVLNFVIITFNSSHNYLLGRTAMQRMGIAVSKIHRAIKIPHSQRSWHRIFNATFWSKKHKGTYQRLIDMVFNNQIGHNLEVHVDDMVIKSDSEEDMLVDNQETFDKLRAINMKLDPRKCFFGIEKGPILGHLITKQRIKANPSKVKEIFDLQPPKTVKEIQSLNKKMAALSQFISKGANKAPSLLKREYKCTLASRKRKKAGRNSVKGHILADFLAETPLGESKEKEAKEITYKEEEPENMWKLYMDRASSSVGSRAGLMLVNPKRKEYTYALRFEFDTTTNEAEYEALLAGLRITACMKIQDLNIFVDF